jgi:hypothetical protein
MIVFRTGGAITVHVAMNIRDCEGLYGEVARVFKRGATFGIRRPLLP